MTHPVTQPIDRDDQVRQGLARIHALAYELITEVARDRIERPALLDALCRLADDAEECLLTHDGRD